MSTNPKTNWNFFRKKEATKTMQQDAALNRELDRYSVRLIKLVGIFGIALGIVILVAFWVWVIKMLYKIG